MPRGRTEDSVFRDDETLRVSNHLTPRVNRVSYMTHPTVLMSTVATWIKDLNPKQLRAVARNATPLKNRVLDVVRRMLSGRGGATDPTDAPSVRVLLPTEPFREGRGELNSPASIRPFLDGMGKTVKPRGLSPRYFTPPSVKVSSHRFRQPPPPLVKVRSAVDWWKRNSGRFYQKTRDSSD